MEKFKLFEADIDVDGVVKKSVELKQEISNLRLEQQKLKATVGETSEEYVKNEAQLKKVSREFNMNQKQVQNLSDTNGNLLTVQQKLNIALNKESKSINAAAKNNKELKAIRNDINTETIEGQKAIEAINKKLNENTEIIKGNTSALEQQKINIGNYPDALDGLIGGFVSATKASLAFIATPIGAVLAVIAGVILLVKTALDRSEESTNKIKRAFSAFTGIGNSLFKVLEPLADFLIDGIAKGFEFVEKAIYKGIDAIAAGLELLGFEDQAKSLRAFNAEVQESAKDAKALADAEALLAKEQRNSQKIQLEYQRDAEKLRQIRDNENLSIRERIQANEELGVVLQKQLAEELRIAELALEVANLRIEAEGKSTALLDEQAEALTTIADIQERITGQESEQLTNRVSLQREAADKAREIADKAIAEQEAQLELFLQQQGVRAKSYQDQLKIIDETYKRELAIVEANLKNRNITETEAEAERLRLKNELLLSQTELASEQAQRELDIYIDKNQSKLESDVFFSEESLRIEEERLNGIRDKQQEFFEQQLENGIINQQEYNDAINNINEENRIALEEAQNERDEAQREKDLIDLENKRLADQELFQDQFQLQLERLEQERKQEVDNAKKTGADVELINKRFAAAEVEIKKQAELSKFAITSNILGQIQGLLKEGTAASKFLGIAQATIDTYIGANKALATLPPPFGAIQAGVTIATGLGNVAKIGGVKFEDGGVIDIGGKRHSAGGTKFYGEDGTRFEAEAGEKMFILNRRASAAIAPVLSGMNQKYGGVSLDTKSSYLNAGGQILRSASRGGVDVQALESTIIRAVAMGSEIGSMKGAMQGALEGSRQGSMEGSMRGSSQGTYEGLVDRIDNDAIEAGANF